MQEENASKTDSFGSRLKKARKLLKMGQSELSETIGYTGYQAISRYERGERSPDASILVLLSELLNVSSDWLLKGEKNQNLSLYLNECHKRQPLPIEKASQELNVPERFVQAIIDGEVSPTKDFYKRLCDSFGLYSREDYADKIDESPEKRKKRLIGEAALYNRNRENTASESKNEELEGKLQEMYERYVNLNDRRDEELREMHKKHFELEKIVEKLRKENEELRKRCEELRVAVEREGAGVKSSK